MTVARNQIDPKTRMTNAGITPEQVEAVRMFVWKTSIENWPTKIAGATAAKTQ